MVSAVVAAGGQHLAVRAEGHREDLTGMKGGTHLLAGGYIPQLDGPVEMPGGQQVCRPG